MTTRTKAEPRRWWGAYSGDQYLGRVGADNSGRAIAKAAKEFGLPAKAITVVSEKTGEAPKGKGTAIATTGGRTYQELNEIARQGMATFREVGTALLEIQERKLYREGGYSSFEHYLKSEHSISKSAGYRLIDAAKVANEISDESEKCPSAGTFSTQPESEMQVRSLKTVPEGQRAEAWETAVAESNGQPTAEKVGEVAGRFGGHSLVEGQTGSRNGATTVNGKAGHDPRVDAARKAGRIPDGVDVEVTDPGDDATNVQDVAEDIAEAKAISEDQLTDPDWLATLPLSSALKGVSLDTFRRDAVAYREVDTLMEEYRLKPKLRSTIKHANPQGKMSGAYASAVGRFLRHQHPRDWRVCPPPDKGGCGGNGSLISGQCNTCRGRGYTCQ